MCGRAGRPGEPRPVFARAGSRPKRAMLPGRGGRVELGPRVRPGTVSRPKRAMLPGRGGRVDLSRRSPGASARAPCESVSPARGCPLAAWQTVSPRQAGRANFGRCRSGEAPKEFPGVGTTLFNCTTPKGLNLYIGGGGRRAMRAGAVRPARCQAKNVRAGRSAWNACPAGRGPRRPKLRGRANFGWRACRPGML